MATGIQTSTIVDQKLSQNSFAASVIQRMVLAWGKLNFKSEKLTKSSIFTTLKILNPRSCIATHRPYSNQLFLPLQKFPEKCI